MPTIHLRRAGLAAAATTLAIGAGIAGAGSAVAADDFELTRLAGDNRYETAVKAAEQFGTAETVILASGEAGRYADALTANYLAGIKKAPVLLTKHGETPEAVKKALSDSGAKNVILVGGPGAISEAQEKTLRGTYTVQRLAGDDRFDTAAAVIAEGDEAATNTALLATGLDFPDALGGGPVAYAKGMPLAITRPGDAPDNVVRALKQAGITRVLVLGGESAVSQAVLDELKAAGIQMTQRFDGDDRAETSGLLAAYAVKTLQMDDTAVNVASGYVQGDGADALGGAALTGKQGRTLLISKSDKVAGEGVITFLRDHAANLSQGVIFGGTGALSQDVEYEMAKAVLGSGAQNARTGDFYSDVQAAIDAAEKGDTIKVFGSDLSGFTVNKPDLTIQGEDASLKEAIVVQGADNVTISGFTITPSSVGGQVAGIYLNDVDDATISDNTVLGTNEGVGAGVINEIGGGEEVARISENTFRDLRQGVYANPSADFVIDSNEFRNNSAGSANDTASEITNNEFVNNDEGIGLGAAGSTVKGNSFTNNSDAHVGDYTTDSVYDLKAMIGENTFDEAVVVTPTEDSPTAPEYIKDES